MTKASFGSHPFLLGFEELERLVERTAKTDAGYPPYNIEQTAAQEYRITLAVAGFSEASLEITLEQNQLMVRGKADEGERERVYLHRGIAARQFQRTFLLADGMEVASARLENGLLHIALKRTEPETRVQKIAIGE